MEIEFTKMHGLGNDFVVIDAINQDISLNAKQVQFIADRHFGIGCDQLLMVEKSDSVDADFRYRIYNNNGGEVEQCGNGARCFAQFVHTEGLTDKTEISVLTSNGRIVLNLQDNGNVTVDMGSAILNPPDIPFQVDQIQTSYDLEIDNEKFSFRAVSMGNPHAVLLVADVMTAEVERIGRALQNHQCFPNSVNVGFMQIIDSTHVKLRVYERGVGETQACGSGACAAVVAGRIQGLLEETVEMQLLGGNLSIHWAGDKNPVMMTGATSTVFKGKIII
ncbi:MAG: diaminopimelate epimerase [Cocleimonas sp.]|jgi:diaminopimelate epimerase